MPSMVSLYFQIKHRVVQSEDHTISSTKSIVMGKFEPGRTIELGVMGFMLKNNSIRSTLKSQQSRLNPLVVRHLGNIPVLLNVSS